mmetsp:Transcript_110856/g.203296  ORF Transcript_110856/g.203296 Transcript_110856/m.203296 type:complete len:405 (-) Transcript_110856:9-1223(-)
MHFVILVCAGLAVACHGRRLRTLKLPSQPDAASSSSEVHRSKGTANSVNAVALLLSAWNPAAAFHTSALGTVGREILDRPSRLGQSPQSALSVSQNPCSDIQIRKNLCSDIQIRNALRDARSGPSERSKGKGYVHLDFPESLRNHELDEPETLHELKRFLQEAGPDNNNRPIFPKDDYVLLFSHYLRRGPQEVHAPQVSFHTDAPGGPDFLLTFWFFPYCSTDPEISFEEFLQIFTDSFEHPYAFDEGNFTHANVIAAACAYISDHDDPRKCFQESGILTCNAWWVTKGTRALKLLPPPALAKLTHGKSIWDLYARDTGPQYLSDLDSSISEDAATELAEVRVAREGEGSLFNSALVLHKGSEVEELEGNSREVRIAAFPISLLNEVAGSEMDWSDLHLFTRPG